MKYSKLSNNAKITAIQEYINGWKETHPDDNLTFVEADKLCKDTENDVEYNINGGTK